MGVAQVLELVIVMKRAELAQAEAVDFDSGVVWTDNGEDVMAVAHLTEPLVSVINLNSWEVVRQIPVQGGGRLLRSHENSRYIWVGQFVDSDMDALGILDKETFETVKVLRPYPGAEVLDVSFSMGGGHALVSFHKNEHAVSVYDTTTLQKLIHLPISNPVAVVVQN